MNNVFNRQMSIDTIMAEGLDDYREIKAARAVIAARERSDGKNPAMIRMAKRHAERLGLTYWPALIRDGYQPKIDPMAYVYAEDVLERKHGLWDGKTNSGGWDSCGHYGLRRHQVRHHRQYTQHPCTKMELDKPLCLYDTQPS